MIHAFCIALILYGVWQIGIAVLAMIMALGILVKGFLEHHLGKIFNYLKYL